MEAHVWEDRVAELWGDASVTDETRIERMLTLARDAPHAALGEFELGGVYDSAGREAEADLHYRAAWTGRLGEHDPARAAQLAIQHASTLRNLGRIDEAIEMLQSAPPHPSTGSAHAVFLALALHSAGRGAEALRVVIEEIEPGLPLYRRSVRAYAAELTD